MSTTDQLFPEVGGSFEERPPVELLAELGRLRFTGLLEAHDGPKRWELKYRGGDVVTAESTEAGDAVETLTELTKGRFRLSQQLLLPGGEVIHRRLAEGDLGTRGALELFKACEAGGLSGALRLLSDGRFAELQFDAGSPTSITLDGHQDVQVQELFGWTSGYWAILARPAFDPTPRPEDSGVAFLREVAVALSDLLEPLPAEARVETHRSTGPEESSVRVIYLDTVKPLEDSASTPSRYARTDLTAVQVFSSSKRKKKSQPKEDEVTEPRPPRGDDPKVDPAVPAVEDESRVVEEGEATQPATSHSGVAPGASTGKAHEEAEPAAEPATDEADRAQASDEPKEADDQASRDAVDEPADAVASPAPLEPAPKDAPAQPAWPDRFWVWILAGLALAALIGLLQLTTPGSH